MGERSGEMVKSKKIPRIKPKKKILDDLWSDCIKARAGYKSELSGKPGKKIGGDYILTAHHIVGKPNNRLRYELDNGICLENRSEHIFGVHSKDPAKSREYQDKIINKIGQKKYEKLLSLRHSVSKQDLQAIKIYLQIKLIEFKEKL